jgi:hypothetical protein
MMKGEVIYTEDRGKGVTRIGARVGDVVYWWTGHGPAPARGALVEIPSHAKAEPAKAKAENGEADVVVFTKTEPEALPLEAKAGPSAEEVERMLRAVALKAAASLYAGHGTEAKELVLACAEEFLAWLRGGQIKGP